MRDFSFYKNLTIYENRVEVPSNAWSIPVYED